MYPWNAAYRLASGKIRNSTTISTLKRKDGSYTTGLANTMNFIMDNFMPADEEGTDNEYHKQIRTKSMQPLDTEDDRPFTEAEIGSIINNTEGNKASGEDGINE